MPDITIKSEKFSIPAYIALSKNPGAKGGVILIHEVWGLNDNIRSIAGSLAQEGYVVLAPDLISHTGILENIDQGIMAQIKNPATKDEAQKKMRTAMAPIMAPEFGKETIQRLQACFDYLKKEQDIARVALMGFCFGGTYSYNFAAHEPSIALALPFYGHAPKDEKELANINCPVMAFYGEQDVNLMLALPELEASFKKLGKNFQYKVYQNTGHAFMNDTNPSTYNKEAAEDAWKISLELLKKYL